MNKQIESFIEKRPELADYRKIILRYLAEISDVISIEEKPKGASLVKCEFDCGAYKGSEILTWRISNLRPIAVANALEKLTSGHHFSFQEADDVLLSIFNKKASQ